MSSMYMIVEILTPEILRNNIISKIFPINTLNLFYTIPSPPSKHNITILKHRYFQNAPLNKTKYYYALFVCIQT